MNFWYGLRKELKSPPCVTKHDDVSAAALDWMHFMTQTQGGSLTKDSRFHRSVRVQFWLQLWSVSDWKNTKWRIFCRLVSPHVSEIMSKEGKLISIYGYNNKICKLNIWRIESDGTREGMRMNRSATWSWRETKTQSRAQNDGPNTQSEPAGRHDKHQ